MAISICDFEIWPAAEQEKQNLPPVPMLSRWNMTERSSKNHGLLQVQYAFLELPKMPAQRPGGPGAGLWAWLFVHAPELTEVPTDLSPGPYREALELANEAKFTREERETYERVRDEIRQVIEFAAARWAQGEAAGKITGKIEAIFAFLAARGLVVSAEVRARIKACQDVTILDLWIARAATASSAEAVLAPPAEFE